MEMEKVVPEAEELPKAAIRRIVKDTLSRCSTSDDDTIVSKDSVAAFTESARIFIHYLSATANDICKESGKQIISADDAYKALEEIVFPEFVGPLKSMLNEFKQKNADKKIASPSKQTNIKRKAESSSKKSEGKSKKSKGSTK